MRSNKKQLLFTAKNISIEFSGVRILNGVDFEIGPGEIRALVGTNGAGKSTLMKVFSGVYPDYGGDIYCNGKKSNPRTPAEAQKLGIRIVHQEVDAGILPDFTVYENLLLADVAQNDEKGRFLYRRRELRRKAADILSELDIDLKPEAKAKTLTLAEKQLLLIAKEVHKECRLLILDEPTAALSKTETEKLFRLIKQLAEKQNTAIIFISHRIKEILGICESCTVMCGGRITDDFRVTEKTNIETIVEKMLGGSIAGYEQEDDRERESISRQPTMLQVTGLCDNKDSFRQISFSVKKGEIVGLAGLVGAGKTEICKALFGARKSSAGVIQIDGREVVLRKPSDAVRHKIALIPEERRKEGIFLSESIGLNLCVACMEKFCRLSFLAKEKMADSAKHLIEELRVVCRNEKQKVRYLSGGNQQKIVIGKWIAADCDIYLLDEPMQGVDIGAKQEIFGLIRKLAKKGAGVLYLSSDVSELLSVTDRIYVLYKGEISAELQTKETSEEEITYYIVGGNHG